MEAYRDVPQSRRCRNWNNIPLDFPNGASTGESREASLLPSRDGQRLSGSYVIQQAAGYQERIISWHISQGGQVVEFVEDSLGSSDFEPFGLRVQLSNDHLLVSSSSVMLAESATVLRIILATRRHALHWLDFPFSNSFKPSSSSSSSSSSSYSSYSSSSFTSSSPFAASKTPSSSSRFASKSLSTLPIFQFSPMSHFSMSDCCPRYQLRTARLLSIDCVAFGCETGEIVCIQFRDIPGANPEEVVLNGRSMFGRLLSWGREGLRSPIIDLAPLNAAGTQVLALTEQGGLEIWDLPTRTRLLSQALTSRSDQYRATSLHLSGLPGLSSTSSLRGLDLAVADLTPLHLVVSLTPSAASNRPHLFHILYLTQEVGQWQLIPALDYLWLAPPSAPSPFYLVDYHVSRDDGLLWSLWNSDEAEQAELCHSAVSIFASAAQARPLVLSTWVRDSLSASPHCDLSRSPDPQRQALQFLLSPAFSVSTLQAALYPLTIAPDSDEQQPSDVTREALYQRLVHQSSQDFDSPLARWQYVINICTIAWRLENSPVALTSYRSAPLLLKQSGLCRLRKLLAPELLHAAVSDSWARNPFEALPELQVLTEVLRTLSHHLTPDLLHNFHEDLLFTEPVSAAFARVMSLLTAAPDSSSRDSFLSTFSTSSSSSSSYPSLSSSAPLSFVLSLGKAVQELIASDSLVATLDLFLDNFVLGPQTSSPAPFSISPPSQTSAVVADHVYLTRIVVHIAGDFVAHAFDLLRDLTILLLLLSQLRSTYLLTEQQILHLHEHLLPKALKLLQQYSAAKWLFSRGQLRAANFDRHHKRAQAGSTTRFLWGGCKSPLPSIDPDLSIVHLFALLRLGASTTASDLTEQALRLLSSLLQAPDNLALCDFLLEFQEITTLERWLALFPHSHLIRNYYLGLCSVHRGQAGKAELYFLRIAGVFESLQLPSAAFSSDLDTATSAAEIASISQHCRRHVEEAGDLNALNSSSTFFMAVYYLFHSHRFPVEYCCRFARLAVQTCEDIEAKKAIWVRIFRLRLESGDYAAAAETLLEFFAVEEPSAAGQLPTTCTDEQRVCLHLLVTTLCEQQLVPLLISLPVIGLFVREIDALLYRKAEKLAVSHRPNYYEVLYSLRLIHGDFRGAGSAMLRYSERLRDEKTAHTAAHEHLLRDALVAAISAFKVMGEELAIVLPTGNSQSQEAAAQEAAAVTREADFSLLLGRQFWPVAASSTDSPAKRGRDGHSLIMAPSSPSFSSSSSLSLRNNAKNDDASQLGFNHSFSSSSSSRGLAGARSGREEWGSGGSEEEGLLTVEQALDGLGQLPAGRIVTLAKMEQDYLVAHARYLLAAENVRVSRDSTSGELVLSLLRIGAVSVALAMCGAFKVPLSIVFEALTGEYLKANGKKTAVIGNHYGIDLLKHYGQDEFSDHMSHQLLWELLAQANSYQYLEEVAYLILSHGLSLPPSLTTLFDKKKIE